MLRKRKKVQADATSTSGIRNVHGRNRGPAEDPLVEKLFGPPQLHKMTMQTMRKKTRPDAYGAHLKDRKDMVARVGRDIQRGNLEAAEDTAGIGAPPSRNQFERHDRALRRSERRRKNDRGGNIRL